MRVLALSILFLAVASAASVHPLKASSELFGRVKSFELISIAEHSRSFDHQRSALNTFREESSVSHPRALQLKFGAFGKQFHLELQINENLFGRHYREFGMLNGGTIIKNTNTGSEVPNCFYQGFDRSSSMRSAVDTCNGFRGLVHAHDESFFVEPAAPHIEGFSSSSVEHSVTGSQHLIYRLADIDQGNWACGVTDSESGATHYHPLESADQLAGSAHDHDHDHDHSAHFQSHTATRTGSSSGFRTQATQKWVELLIVNDHERYVQKGSSTVFHSAGLVNIAQTMYSNSVPFGLDPAISLVLIGQITFLDSNPWGVPTKNSLGQVDASALLANLSNYRIAQQLSLPTHDDAQMLSGNVFIPPTIGLAKKPGTCFYSLQNGIEQATALPDIIVGITLAHEMGHNFNLSHDPVTPDPCAGFVMQASICPQCATQPSRFSNCSVAQFGAFAATIGCLNNDPGSLRWDNPAICGDGFVEGNEQCDCGSNVDCTASVPASRQDVCCNAATCTLTGGSVCSNLQPCCQGCQVITSNTTVCRAAANNCDLPETCNGTSANCPTDNVKNPGSSCTDSNGPGACYQGTCHTVASQCIAYSYQYRESCLSSATDCYNIGCYDGTRCVTIRLAGILPEDGTACSSAGEGGICVGGVCGCRASNNSAISCPAGPSDDSDNKALQFFKDNWLWIAIGAGSAAVLLLLYCCCCRKGNKAYDPEERPRKKMNPALELNRAPQTRDRGDSLGVPMRNVANSVGGGTSSGHVPYPQSHSGYPSPQYSVVPSPQSHSSYAQVHDSQSSSQFQQNSHHLQPAPSAFHGH